MLIAYKQKLYNSSKNKHIGKLLRLYGICYNHCIALHKRYYRLYKRHLKLYTLQKHITKLKRTTRFSFLKLLGSQTLQELVERIDKALKKFFKKQGRPPRFKKVANYQSFTFKGKTGYKIQDNIISFNGYAFKFVKTYDLVGKPKTLTIKRDNLGDYFLCLVCEVADTPKPAGGNSVGLDFGLKTFLTCSNGTQIPSPLFFSKYLPLIRACSRSLSKKKRGSHRRLKARLKLARLYRKIKNLRTDFFYKLANSLSKQYATIFIEDLNLKGMVKLWGRKINDLAFSEFVAILERKTQVVKIDRFYPSSKTCSSCGAVKKDLSLKDRVFKCPSCGFSLDRDLNASINIHRVGASTLGVEAIRPA
ncbi:RNA-guided endonuclease TnpB family protein [Helicobacter ailurogastricus]|uniref:RNA-guided endonuclease InsQ/TnpB family protein n=1 Tax=Helicobacter ailurogastricus TaxID=1578720 RepID=UPI00244D7D7F|nr:transposase [Helicobacter ailurogastricus]GMB90813.1 RNA-guided endonuclease TnpB family protein [Helicobacter ailurogastricus]